MMPTNDRDDKNRIPKKNGAPVKREHRRPPDIDTRSLTVRRDNADLRLIDADGYRDVTPREKARPARAVGRDPGRDGKNKNAFPLNQPRRISKKKNEVRRKPVRRPLTEAEIRRREAAKRRAVKRIGLSASAFLAFYIVIALIIAMYINFSFAFYGKKPTQYTLKTGYTYVDSYNRVKFYEESKSKVYIGGVQYVSTDQLSTLGDFALTGKGDDFTILLSENDVAVFRVGSCNVTINGVSKILTNPIQKSRNSYYVPTEFIKYSLLGVEFTENSEKFIYEVQKNDIYSNLRFVNNSNQAPQRPSAYDFLS